MDLPNLVTIHMFILKILNGNEILTSFKGHNSVMYWQKWKLNNPELDVVNINAYYSCQFWSKIHSFILKILSGKESLTSFKGHNSATNWWKWMLNNQKLDVVNINAYRDAKFCQNPSIWKCSQDIERKENVMDGQTDEWTTSNQYHPRYFVCRGYKLTFPVTNLAARFGTFSSSSWGLGALVL